MSKFFFKGRIEKQPKYGSSGYNTKRAIKLGTQEHPLTLIVANETRKAEVESILKEHTLFADIEINQEVDENLVELDSVLNKPKTTVFEKTPNRNDPCSCGSGKKYKKCCGK